MRHTAEGRPYVIAYVEPSVRGARESLERHAQEISTAVLTGLLLDGEKSGELIDRIDLPTLNVAQARNVQTEALVQNLDPTTLAWRSDTVARLGRDPAARARLAAAVEALCERRRLVGVHLDLEEIGDSGWGAVVAVARDLAAALHAHHRTIAVDVPPFLDEAVLVELSDVSDRVVVMAYDEHDENAVAGPIASNAFVDAALDELAVLPQSKVVAGLGIYGYDWNEGDPATPISFTDVMAAAKEAGATVRWDASGNPTVRHADEEGGHETWFLDGATLWNQLALARRHGIDTVALWRLGGEDPGIWQALAGDADASGRLGVVPADEHVDNQGDGPFLALALSPEPGRRELDVSDGLIVDERWQRLPSPYVVRRGGIVPGKVALTFDDGPDPTWTPAILDVLRERQVPATFFVVGLNAAQYPSLIRREVKERHEVGNHSFTHPDVDRVGDGRLAAELEATTRLVENIAGIRPRLYRPPSLADIEPRTTAGAAAFARAGSLGYLVVDADVDPRDWESPTVDNLVARVLDGASHGGVVLLHDGGGDRSVTLRALPRIIDGLRARGLDIVPLAELVGKKHDEVMPPARARGALRAVAERMVFAVAGRMKAMLSWSLTIALLLAAARALLVMALAGISARRRPGKRGPLPSATVVIPAFNEREVILRTVRSVLTSDVPVDVIVVDDGSTDGTADLVRRHFARDFRVRLVQQKNAGKAAALRAGFRKARTEAVIALDGDTLFAPDTVRRLLEPMRDERVGAVAGTALVGNIENGLTACQALEYRVQQELERRAWDALGALPVVPGAVGAWRRHAVEAVGGFRHDTLAEDADLSMALCRAGWRVVHAPRARAWTEAPATVAALLKQRRRWAFGTLQAMWKHRRALVEKRAGGFGRVVMPSMLLFQVLMPLVTPAALVAVTLAVVSGHLRPALIASAVLLVLELSQLLMATWLARRNHTHRQFPLFRTFLLSRLFYRPLLFFVSVRALLRVLDGIPLGWNKLARRNTVTLASPQTLAFEARSR